MRKLLLELMTVRGLNKKYNDSLFSPRANAGRPNGLFLFSNLKKTSSDDESSLFSF